MRSIIAIGLIILSSILIFFNVVAKNSNYIGLKNIFKEQFKMFSSSKWQYVIVYVYPIFLSVGIDLLYVADCNMYQNIIVAISIFVSMLFAMMSILTAKDTSIYPTQKQRDNVESVLKETNNAVVFCVSLAVFEIILCLVAIAIQGTSYCVVNRILWGVIVYLFEILLLNMMIIVKRLSKVV